MGAESSPDLPTTSSSPLSESPRLPQTGNSTSLRQEPRPYQMDNPVLLRQVAPPSSDGSHQGVFDVVGPGEQTVGLLQCQQVANELKETMRRAAHLHQQVNFLSDRLYVAAPVKYV